VKLIICNKHLQGLSDENTYFEMVVCFVDIGGIVDLHCLNFLFKNIYIDIDQYILFLIPVMLYFREVPLGL
jgi:hypothetical protein